MAEEKLIPIGIIHGDDGESSVCYITEPVAVQPYPASVVAAILKPGPVHPDDLDFIDGKPFDLGLDTPR